MANAKIRRRPSSADERNGSFPQCKSVLVWSFVFGRDIAPSGQAGKPEGGVSLAGDCLGAKPGSAGTSPNGGAGIRNRPMAATGPCARGAEFDEQPGFPPTHLRACPDGVMSPLKTPPLHTARVQSADTARPGQARPGRLNWDSLLLAELGSTGTSPGGGPRRPTVRACAAPTPAGTCRSRAGESKNFPTSKEGEEGIPRLRRGQG